MFKRRLVKFDDGNYGVRTYWFFGWHFLDLENGFNCKINTRRFTRYCKTSFYQEAERNLTNKYSILK